MSRVWLTGKISEEELRKEHPEEYDEINKDKSEEWKIDGNI